MWFLVLLSAFTLMVLYLVGIKPFRHWKKLGVPYIKPLPFVGNMGPAFIQQRSFADLSEDLYKSCPDKRYVGVFQFLVPTLMIRDPELIKRITVKDFDCFADHRALVPDEVDPMWSRALFGLRGQKWHDMRATVSPSFTSSKMKMMFGLIKDCAKQFVDHFEKQDGFVSVELKDVFTRYTNDVIATTAFGVTCDSLKDRDNEFYAMGRDAFNFTGIKALTFFLSTVSPVLAKILNVPIFSKAVRDFFQDIILKTMKLREEKGIVRPDMIHLLMEARKHRLQQENDVIDLGFAVVHEAKLKTSQRKIEITDEDIVAQALIFFGGGFDTTSTFMCFTAYELAINPEVQEKLIDEVDKTLEANQGEITYEALIGMKYLDMVVTEALRKWPPGTMTDRLSVKPYTIEPELPGEKSVTIEPGTSIMIPQYALQRDPKYYPNPDKFDPERFSDENKHNIKPYTYMPFGMGPRSCIGSRLALLEGKLVIAELLSKFEIVPTAKTQIPIEIGKGNIFPVPKDGFWLGLKPRSS